MQQVCIHESLHELILKFGAGVVEAARRRHLLQNGEKMQETPTSLVERHGIFECERLAHLLGSAVVIGNQPVDHKGCLRYPASFQINK